MGTLAELSRKILLIIPDVNKQFVDQFSVQLGKVEDMSIAGASLAGSPTIPMATRPPSSNPKYYRLSGEASDAHQLYGAGMFWYSGNFSTLVAQIDPAEGYIFNLTYTEATAGEQIFKITATDSVDQTAGMLQTLLVDHNITGAKSSTAHSEGISVDMNIGSNTNTAYAFASYISQSDNPNMSVIEGMNIYLEDMGTGTLGSILGLDIGINSTNVGSGRHAGMRIRNHSGTATDAILIEATFGTVLNMAGATTTQDIILSSNGKIGGSSGHLKIDSSGNTTLTGDLRVDGANIGITSDADLVTMTANTFTIAGTVAATTVTGANVTTGADPGHTHTGSSVGSIDISDDTNLAVTAPVVLTDDTLSMPAATNAAAGHATAAQITALEANTVHLSSIGTDHGYIDQDVTIATSPTFSGLTLDGVQIIDHTSTEALLVRQNADAADVFTVDTSTPRVVINDGSAGGGGAAAAVLRVESANFALLEFLSPDGSADFDGLAFSDSVGNNRGRLVYRHSVNTMFFYTDGGQKLTIDASGNMAFNQASSITTASGNLTVNPTGDFILKDGQNFIGDDANTFMTVGFTINQGANDDDIFGLKSSDVAHGITDIAETDTYARLKKTDAGDGGLRIDGFTQTDRAYWMNAFVTTEVTTKADSSNAAYLFNTALKDGAGRQAMSANTNLIAFRNDGTNVVLIDAEGTYHITIGDNDVDIFSLPATTGTPKLYWDESEDKFVLTKGLIETGDLEFTGDGAGLVFGEIYANDVADTITIATAGQANKVQITSFTVDGLANNMTVSNANDDITILVAGMYFCAVSVTLSSAGGGGADDIGFAVYKNNGTTEFANLHGHRKLAGGGGDRGSATMSGIVDLAVNDTIEVWVWNEDSTDNVVVDDITLSLIMIGGT